jgi:hypothetical protein
VEAGSRYQISIDISPVNVLFTNVGNLSEWTERKPSPITSTSKNNGCNLELSNGPVMITLFDGKDKCACFISELVFIV